MTSSGNIPPQPPEVSTAPDGSATSAAPASAQVLAPPAARRRRFVLPFFLLFSVLTAMFLALCAWVFWSQSGTRQLFRLAESASAGSLHFSGINGRLADHLQIDELSLRSTKLRLAASGIRLDWQPRSLLSGVVNIDTLEMVSLRIASTSDRQAASLPLDLRLPVELNVKRAALGRLQLASLQADGRELPTVQLSAISAQLLSNHVQHQINGNLASPWGALQLQLKMASSRPYALQGQFSYQGQVNKSVPHLGLQGSLAGSLDALSIQAKAIADPPAPVPNTKSAPNTPFATPLQGGLNAVVSLFSPQILRSLQANITGFNPADFNLNAPQADMHLQADLRAEPGQAAAPANTSVPAAAAGTAGTVKLQAAPAFALIGTLKMENHAPARYDQHGIPVLALSTALRWSSELLVLKDTRIQLPGTGLIQGAASIQLPSARLGTSGAPATPQIDSQFDVSGVNLALLDSRVQASQIRGTIRAQSKSAQLLTLQMQLTDPRASLSADASYQASTANEPALLELRRFELRSADSRLSGQAKMDFSVQQHVSFKGELHHFDPARWVAGPSGSLDAELSVQAELQPKLLLDVQLSRLQGQYAGQPVSGLLLAKWQQDALLSVQKMDFRWGQNKLNAEGVWGQDKGELLLKLEAPDLPAFSDLLQQKLTGSLQAEVHLRGSMAAPAGKLTLAAQGVGVKNQLRVDKLSADIDLANGLQGVLNAELLAQDVWSNLGTGTQESPLVKAEKNMNAANAGGTASTASKSSMPLSRLAEQLKISIKGRRDAHVIDLTTRINPSSQLVMNASGGLAINAQGKTRWSGRIERLNLLGSQQAQLLGTMQLEADSQRLRLGSAQLSGALGKLAIDQFEWTPGLISTRGKISDAKVMDIFNLISPQYAIDGDLLIGAEWDVQLKDNVRGDIRVLRQSGDIRINDPDGTGTPVALGLSDLQMRVALGGLVAGTDAERISLQLSAAGARLGNWQVKAASQLRKVANQWSLPADAPLTGSVLADIPDLQWVGPWLNPGLALKGKLMVDAGLRGSIGAPGYRAQIDGRELEAAFASEGLLLPNGILSAEIDEERIKLKRLVFSNTVTMMPRHAQFQGINWKGQKGEFSATGEVDWRHQSGNIKAQWTQFPLLQRSDRWLVVTGQATIDQSNQIWALNGKMVADGGYFKLPKLPPPSLSSDVVVIRRNGKTGLAENPADTGKKGLKSRVDVTLDMGPRFVFVGRGIDTALNGSIRLRSIDGAPLQASGSIRTVDGVYEGYGQQLAIERGILNFQGSPGNPDLNIRALRLGLQVEAGLEVAGSLSAPQVRLVSEPNVPDAEKISWLVLGRGSDQIAGNDASLLMSAASAIFGGDGSRNIPRDLVQGLGFDEFSIGAADAGGASKLPGQTVAGSTTNANAIGSTAASQVVSVGKRLAPGLVLSVERGLSDASGAIKLSWQLTRRISIIGRAGSEASLDAYYTFSFH